MKKKKRDPLARLKKAFSPRENLIWGLLAAALWTFQVLRLHDPSVVFPFWFFLKGLVLIAGAAWVYQVSVPKKDFSFLGLFPLAWLALSQFQWSLCAGPYLHDWLWLALFLLVELFILTLSDGRKLLFILFPLWAGLSWLSSASVLLPLVFLFAPSKRFKRVGWIKWGGAFTAGILFILLKGWPTIGFNWIDISDFLVTSRYLAFLMLGWLGLAAFPQKGTGRHAAMAVFAVTLGFVFWPAMAWDPHRLEILKWVLVFFAGFGWESFRRDLMDDTWHGHLVWFSLGIALFGGVL